MSSSTPPSPSLRRSASPAEAPPAKRPKAPAPVGGPLLKFFSPGEPDRPPPRAAPGYPPLRPDALKCVDLFCGAGGWSVGARQAGHEVVYAADFNADVLKLHRRNHPDCKHRCIKLGVETEETLVSEILEAVPPGARWMLHASPPCQSVSALQGVQPEDNRKDQSIGLDLVNWYLRLVLRLKPTYWTFEQVAHQEVVGALRLFKFLHPAICDYEKVNFGTYGLPQHRKRMVAGTPSLMKNFLTEPSLRAPTPKLTDVLTVPENAVYQRSSVGKNPDRSQNILNADGTYTNPTIRRDVRSVHDVSWGCTARHSHAYLTNEYVFIREQTPRETATLQSFPSWYKMDLKSVTVQTRQLAMGNALPPLIAKKLLECMLTVT